MVRGVMDGVLARPMVHVLNFLRAAANLRPPWCYEDQFARLVYNQPVPRAARHDDELTGLERYNLRLLGAASFE